MVTKNWSGWGTILVSFLLTILTASFGLAQTDSPINLTSRVDRSQITIGDLIHYQVRVSRLPNVKVVWPGLGSNLGAFEIRDYEIKDPRKEKGRILEEIGYTISTFDTGAFVIPPLTIQYSIPPDSTQMSLQTEPIEIYVASLRPSLAGDIHGLKPQGILPKDWKRLLLYAGLGLFGLAIVIGIWIFLRLRKKGGLPFIKQPPPRPAHEVAYEALEELKNSGLLEKGELKHFFSRLSEILRAYIEARYFVPALESTTFEIVSHFSRDGQLQGQLEPLEKILNLCDLVKFAKYLPPAEEAEQAMQLSYAFIEATKPLFEVDEKKENGEKESVEAQEKEKLSPEADSSQEATLEESAS